MTSSLIVRMLGPVHSKWQLRNFRYEVAQYTHGVYNSNMHIKIYKYIDPKRVDERRDCIGVKVTTCTFIEYLCCNVSLVFVKL